MTEGATRPWTVVLGCALSLVISIRDIIETIADEEMMEFPSLLRRQLVLDLSRPDSGLSSNNGREHCRIEPSIYLPVLKLVDEGINGFFHVFFPCLLSTAADSQS
jgi:hypothetical protein